MNRELQAPLDVAIVPRREAADAIFRSASVAFPGPRGRKGSADGLQLAEVLSASATATARGCSLSAATTSTAHRTATTKETRK